MSVSSGTAAPRATAAAHVDLLHDLLGRPGVDLDDIAGSRPQWPVWPQVALASLVGPRGTILADLELRWLHRFEATVAVLDTLVAALGGPAGGPSGLSLLVERAVMLGHHGWGTWSAATSCRMIRAADGWLAVNLPREDDLHAVAAWLECPADADAWSLVARELPGRRVDELDERAALLGLAVARVPHVHDPPRSVAPFAIDHAGPGLRSGTAPTVLDLSSLWAGPLCGWYLARAGADVVKVESSVRPDGARRGTPAFYRRLNHGKRLVELDLSRSAGVMALRDLLDTADIVIAASRPRVFTHWGIDPDAWAAGGRIWCSITGYGRGGPGANRVAFGDDAAAAGGLITYVGSEPWFIGDAAADPVAGVTAALATLALWHEGRSGVIDVAMAHAVAAITGGQPVPSRRS